MEKEYTNSEIILLLKAIDAKIDTKDAKSDAYHLKQDEVLSRIEAQVIKTNGRVNKLETWRGFITGGLGVVMALVIPISFKIFK